MLRQAHAPNFMLVHPMGIDNARHYHGADTSEYRGQVLATGPLLPMCGMYRCSALARRLCRGCIQKGFLNLRSHLSSAISSAFLPPMQNATDFCPRLPTLESGAVSIAFVYPSDPAYR